MGLFDFFKRKSQVRESMGDAAISLHNSAVLLMDQGLYEPAEAKFKQSLMIYEEYFDVNCPAVVKGLENLARLYEKTSQFAQAELHYKRALAIKEKGLGSHHPDVIQSQENLAELHRQISQENSAGESKESATQTQPNMQGQNGMQALNASDSCHWALSHFDVTADTEDWHLDSMVRTTQDMALEDGYLLDIDAVKAMYLRRRTLMRPPE